MAITSFSFKIASRCNLNCSYCYVYNKGDSSWHSRPAVMSDEIFVAALERVREYCKITAQDHVSIVFHGGEPTLVGVNKLREWCKLARRRMNGTFLSFGIQTNGTLITAEWARFFREFNVHVGLSVDGPAEIHDRFRVDHRGRGSFERIATSAKILSDFDISFGVLSVVQLGEDPLTCHQALLSLNSKSIGYMLPHFTHDTIGPIRAQFGSTPCADFLLPILDDWWENQTEEIRIREFWNIGRLIMGGRSRADAIGNDPFGYLFVESDGDIEGLDILRICGDESYRTGLNVLQNGFDDVFALSPFHSQLLNGSVPVPSACRTCPEHETCGGGYLPHRHSLAQKFNNPSVWCADLLLLFGRMRELLGVSHDETARLRQQLAKERDPSPEPCRSG